MRELEQHANNKRKQHIINGIKESASYHDLMNGELVPLERDELLYYLTFQSDLEIETLKIQQGLMFYWACAERKKVK